MPGQPSGRSVTPAARPGRGQVAITRGQGKSQPFSQEQGAGVVGAQPVAASGTEHAAQVGLVMIDADR